MKWYLDTWISGYWHKDKDGKYYRWDRKRIEDTNGNLIYYRHAKVIHKIFEWKEKILKNDSRD